ncbi:GGDEF domain-containing protein [Methylobacterium planeticum]|uniref:diguanylate cyclase n=1 Tax=Methylobacterium planeticum TaxID=2615211 RepID=A0A6N6MYN5_9HYPH|nr:GGDEF domain-containing protein [Methylobacterium planeticum]KAB1076276.1 GGDEF domain-containing protein [Methylobacterium planeticum]
MRRDPLAGSGREGSGHRAKSTRLSLVDGLGRDERRALLAEIDAVLACRIRDIKLTARLREIYRAASWRQRSGTVRYWLIWVTLFDAATCVLDYIQEPRILWLSIALRAVLVPSVYGVLVWVWMRPRSGFTEGLTLPVTIAVMMLVGQFLGAAGGGAMHERYLSGALFATATAILVFPMNLRWCVAGTVLDLGLYFLFNFTNPAIELKLPLVLTTFFAFVIGCLVPARQTLNLLLEHAFVLSLRNRLQAEELAEANAQLAVLADTDGLTGLVNRRAISARLTADWTAQAAARGAVGVILIDVDHFKRFNDSVGHAGGDACLCAVAAAIRSAMPAHAVAGRYGGEEFIAIVPDAEPRDLLTLAERVRAAVADLRLRHPGLGEGRHVSVSIGVAIAPAEGPSTCTDALVQIADSALYDAKAAGRNRVVAAWSARGGEPAPAEAGPAQVAAA